MIGHMTAIYPRWRNCLTAVRGDRCEQLVIREKPVTMIPRDCFVIIILLSLNHVHHTTSLHLTGTWNSQDFFKFLSKFGFQKTNMHDRENTQGFIYGNITSKHNVSTRVTFVVVDSEYFLEYYGNRSAPRAEACPAMFKKIDTVSWDLNCNQDGKEDFLRKVPCPAGKLCEEELQQPEKVVPGYQFTYRVQDIHEPRFWYISLSSCHLNDSKKDVCTWDNNKESIELDYDIWLVNGNPFIKHVNPFEHQFSFEMHDVFEIYLVFLVTYSILVPLQLYALSRQKHTLPLLLTSCMSMEYVGVIFNFIHVFKFAFDGTGVELLRVTGNFIDTFAQCLFMLVLLLVVKGWTITRMSLTSRAKAFLFTVWATYTVGNLGLFVWNLMEVDLISDIDEWQTWPGFLILAFRICIMVWFLLELRDTIHLELVQEKRRFYLHFGAGFLVWFVYLPIVAAIGTQLSLLWRYKTILSVTLAADFLSYMIMTHLLWPSRSYLYFNLKADAVVPREEIEITGLLAEHSDASSDELFDSSTLGAKPFTGKGQSDSSSGAPSDLVTEAEVETSIISLQHLNGNHIMDSGIEVDLEQSNGGQTADSQY